MIAMKELVRIVTLILTMSLAGCMMGPDFKKPVVETPVHYRYADKEAETTVNLKWWELFSDPVLVSLVTAALQDNKDVLIAASRIEQARSSLGFVRADLFPRLDLEAGASRGKIPTFVSGPYARRGICHHGFGSFVRTRR